LLEEYLADDLSTTMFSDKAVIHVSHHVNQHDIHVPMFSGYRTHTSGISMYIITQSLMYSRNEIFERWKFDWSL